MSSHSFPSTPHHRSVTSQHAYFIIKLLSSSTNASTRTPTAAPTCRQGLHCAVQHPQQRLLVSPTRGARSGHHDHNPALASSAASGMTLGPLRLLGRRCRAGQQGPAAGCAPPSPCIRKSCWLRRQFWLHGPETPMPSRSEPATMGRLRQRNGDACPAIGVSCEPERCALLGSLDRDRSPRPPAQMHRRQRSLSAPPLSGKATRR
jgi:hypothetical protein